jgi:hypothetical protein
MDTNEVQSSTTGSVPDRSRRQTYAHRALVWGLLSTVSFGSVGVVSAQAPSGGAVGAGSSGLYVTVAALGLTTVSIGAVYFLSWRDRPEQTFSPATQTAEDIPNRHTGRMYESDVAPQEMESVDHDAFDPVGTGTIIAIYFGVIALAWLFMYFVEFLDNGPTVVG